MIRRLLASSTLALALGCASARQGSDANEADLLIRNVSVVDVERGTVRGGQDITVTGTRIVAVTATQRALVSRARVVDGSGKFVIPGLWDMHAHLSFARQRATDELPLFLAHGVTGVRLMGADRPTADSTVALGLLQNRALQSEIERGVLVGPHLLALGSWPVDGPSGISDAMPGFYKAATREGGRQLARHLKAQGFDFIKIYDNVSREGFLGLADEARTLGLPLAGHEPGALSAVELSAAGQRSLEHSRIFLLNCFSGADSLRKGLLPSARSSVMMQRMAREYDAALCAPVFRLFAKNATYITPTHVTRRMEALAHDSIFTSDVRLRYIPIGQRMAWLADARTVAATDAEIGRAARGEFYTKGLSLTNAAYRAGVPVMLGTDANDSFVFPGSSVHDELGELVKAGLTPAEALRSATLAGAMFLGRTADFGAVRVGRVADLVLLDANPLENIEHVRRIAAVIFNGRLFERAALDSVLRAAEIAARPTAQQRLWAASATGDTVDAVSAITAGAKLDSLDPQGNRRALNYAALNNRFAVISVLLARGANINLANRTGFTAVHHAVEAKAYPALQVLLGAKPDLSLKTTSGYTALEFAKVRGDTVAAAILEAASRRP